MIVEYETDFTQIFNTKRPRPDDEPRWLDRWNSRIFVDLQDVRAVRKFKKYNDPKVFEPSEETTEIRLSGTTDWIHIRVNPVAFLQMWRWTKSGKME